MYWIMYHSLLRFICGDGSHDSEQSFLNLAHLFFRFIMKGTCERKYPFIDKKKKKFFKLYEKKNYSIFLQFLQ